MTTSLCFWRARYSLSGEVATALGSWLPSLNDEASGYKGNEISISAHTLGSLRPMGSTAVTSNDGAWLHERLADGTIRMQSRLASWPRFELVRHLDSCVILVDESSALQWAAPVVLKQLIEAEALALGGRVMHASCATGRSGDATVFIGPARAGKTTAALALAEHGEFIAGDRTILVADEAGVVHAIAALQDTRVRRPSLGLLGWDLAIAPNTRRDSSHAEKLVLGPADLARIGIRSRWSAKVARVVVMRGRATGFGVARRETDRRSRSAAFVRERVQAWSPLSASFESERLADALADLAQWSLDWGVVPDGETT